MSGGRSPASAREVAVAGRVVEGVRRAVALGRKLDRLGRREVPGLDRRAGGGAQHSHGPGFDDGPRSRHRAPRRSTRRRARRSSAAASQPGTQARARSRKSREPASVEVGAAPDATGLRACTTRPAAWGSRTPTSPCRRSTAGARTRHRPAGQTRTGAIVAGSNDLRPHVIQAPPSCAVAHEVQVAVRATTRADRSTRVEPAGHAASRWSSAPAASTSATHSSVPSHGMLRMPPADPGERRPVGAEARRRVEVVALGHDAARRASLPSSGTLTSVLTRLAPLDRVVLAHADAAAAARGIASRQSA